LQGRGGWWEEKYRNVSHFLSVFVENDK
jgi:hypothetical protein